VFSSRGLFLSWVKTHFVSECCPLASCCSKNPRGSRRILVGSVKWLPHMHFVGVWGTGRRSKALYRGADKSLARPGRKRATFPAFYGTWRVITTFTRVHTTCPYPRQISPLLCPSHLWQAQHVSFLVGLRTYQHPVQKEQVGPLKGFHLAIYM